VAAFGEYYPGAHHNSERPAIIDVGSGEVLSYARLDAQAGQVAAYFRGRGLAAGDTVTLCFENSAAYLALVWGAHYAGLRYVPTNPASTADELAYVADDSGSELVVMSAVVYERVASELRLGAHVDVAVVGPGISGLAELVGAHAPELPAGAVEGACMFYSSGTTGRPKGIRTPLQGRLLGAEPSLLVALLKNLFGFTGNSVYLSPAPLYHAAPLGYVRAVGELGATAIIMPRFDATATLEAIATHRVTHTQMVPTMFGRLLALPEDVRAAMDVTSLQCVIHAAAPCPVSVKQAMIDWLGPIVHEYYSGSEGVGFVYCSPQDWLARPGTVGRSLLGPIHILDSHGSELPVGGRGKIYFENSPAFEYTGDVQKTHDAFTARGWGTFGDVGYLDEDDFLYIDDRDGELIISGGVNVYPAEVESVLLTHPAVADAVVIGLADSDFGERVHAVVELSAGHDATGELEQDLLQYCRTRLSKQKCPKAVDFDESLPRSETGKMLRRLVRDAYRAANPSMAAP
jgi:fatty-acyl-CoA synthase